MLPRSTAFMKAAIHRNGLRSVLGSIRNKSYVEDFKPVTMDDLPVPSGSWQEAYDKQQRRYNLYLVGSFAFFLVTVGVGKQTGTLNFYTGPSLKN